MSFRKSALAIIVAAALPAAFAAGPAAPAAVNFGGADGPSFPSLTVGHESNVTRAQVEAASHQSHYNARLLAAPDSERTAGAAATSPRTRADVRTEVMGARGSAGLVYTPY